MGSFYTHAFPAKEVSMIDSLKGFCGVVAFLFALTFGSDPTEGEHDPY